MADVGFTKVPSVLDVEYLGRLVADGPKGTGSDAASVQEQLITLCAATATAVQHAADRDRFSDQTVAGLVDCLCAFVQFLDEAAHPELTHIDVLQMMKKRFAPGL